MKPFQNTIINKELGFSTLRRNQDMDRTKTIRPFYRPVMEHSGFARTKVLIITPCLHQTTVAELQVINGGPTVAGLQCISDCEIQCIQNYQLRAQIKYFLPKRPLHHALDRRGSQLRTIISYMSTLPLHHVLDKKPVLKKINKMLITRRLQSIQLSNQLIILVILFVVRGRRGWGQLS